MGRIYIILTCFVIALTIYILYSPDILLFRFFGNHDNPSVYPGSLGERLIRFYGPDLLGTIAIYEGAKLIEEKHLGAIFLYSLLVLPFVCELVQLFPGIPGTFDPVDLVIYSIGTIAFFHKKMMLYANIFQNN